MVKYGHNSRALPVVSGNPKGPAEVLYARSQGLIRAALSRGFRGLTPCQQDAAESYGRLGLWQACLRFDPSRGYQFSTYATACIRGQILRGLKLDADQKRVSCVSLDAPLGDGDDLTRLDTLASDPAQRPDAVVLSVFGFEALMQTLPPRLSSVLRAVYAEGETLQEIAGERGLTRARAGQLQQQGLKHLRKSFKWE